MSTANTEGISGGSTFTAADSAPAEAVVDTPSSPADGGGATTNGANGHARNTEPTTLSDWREQRKKDREAAEHLASRKAELASMPDEQREAESRKSINPLHWENELGVPDAPKPPQSVDEEFEELKSHLGDLEPRDRKLALDHLAELQQRRNEAARIETGKTVEQMKLHHQQRMAAYQAQSTHVAMVDAQMQATFEQSYGVPPTAEGLQYLQATNPELVAQAALEMVSAQHQKQEALAAIEQHQQGISHDDQIAAGTEDHLFHQKMRADNPDVFSEDGKFRPEVVAAVVDYVGSLGLSRDQFKAALQANEKVSVRDHRFQQMVLDASRYRAAKSKAATAIRRGMPEVMRPGLPTGSRRTDLDADIAALESKSGLSLRQAVTLSKLKMRRAK